MHPTSNLIYIVDDDSALCGALTAILTRSGYDVVCFSDTDALLLVAKTKVPACILLDLFVPGPSGLDTLRQLNAPTYPAPVLMMSADCCIATAVDLVRDGAYDFLEKPFSSAELVRRIERARLLFTQRTLSPPSPAAHVRLTPREQEVLTQWVAGATSKEIARKFGISPRTIEIHRSKIMKKMRAKNSAEIVQIAVSNSGTYGVPLRKTA